MRRKTLISLAAVCLLLTGCGFREGNYVHVVPRRGDAQQVTENVVTAGNRQELRDALCSFVAAGEETGIIYTNGYDTDDLASSMENAIGYVQENYPLGSYAVEKITYEIGSNSGRTAVAVSLRYVHGKAEMQKILHLDVSAQIKGAVMQAMEDCEDRIVMEVYRYSDTDITQLVQTIAQENPDKIMETPSVTATVYGKGIDRIVEVGFSYENTREALRSMRRQVQTVFDSAELYVSEEDDDNRKLSQLYAFLMERFDYKQDTSLTPSYSLLRHGVGDSRAFANVYSAMCRRAGLKCLTVTGTRNAEPWTWNIVSDGDMFYHVDLLACAAQGGFRERSDWEMGGYVWDYSSYPKCGPTQVETEEPPQTEDSQDNP